MTQIGLRKTSYLTGDLTWLGSKFGVDEARTVTVDVSAFRSASKITAGSYIKSGEPVKSASVDGSTKYVPYGGSGTLAGFLLTDVPVDPRLADTVDATAALLDHGRVILSKLPSTVASNATTSGQFIFV